MADSSFPADHSLPADSSLMADSLPADASLTADSLPTDSSFPIDPVFWQAIAGPWTQFHTNHSRVYYLPQGHFEEASCPPQVKDSLILTKPVIPCIITKIQYLVDQKTEEVFAKIALQPCFYHPDLEPVVEDPENVHHDVSFAKIITESDRYRTGYFLIPKKLAESIFPPLKEEEYVPTFSEPELPFRKYGQVLTCRDVRNRAWEFEHIYRVDDSTHFIFIRDFKLFYHAKRAVPGDALIFLNSVGRLYLGIRRKKRGRVSPDSVAEAANLAAKDLPFEVEYYPNTSVGWTDFVVKAEYMQEIMMNIDWVKGMRVWIPVETIERFGDHDNGISLTYGTTVFYGFCVYPGTVSNVHLVATGAWPYSPWRMLEIKWDQEMPWDVKWFCPWDVIPQNYSSQ